MERWRKDLNRTKDATWHPEMKRVAKEWEQRASNWKETTDLFNAREGKQLGGADDKSDGEYASHRETPGFAVLRSRILATGALVCFLLSNNVIFLHLVKL